MLGQRTAEVTLLLAQQAALQLTHEDAELPLGGASRPPASAREAVPSAREREEVGARSPAVRRKHRAHAAVAVHVGAGDDPRVCLYALEHRPACGRWQAVDRATEIVDWSGADVCTLWHTLVRRRVCHRHATHIGWSAGAKGSTGGGPEANGEGAAERKLAR